MLNVDRMMPSNDFFIWVPLLFLCSSLLLLKTIRKQANPNNKLLPPGPPKLPLLGHLHLIGSLPHRSLSQLSKKYGPVMLLQLGSVPTIVISSAAAARELFKFHDLASCSRPLLTGSGRFSYNFVDLNLSPYGERWRELRKICMLQLFNPRRVESFQEIREEEVGRLVNSISQSSSSSSPIDLSDKLYSLTANITTRVAFGSIFSGGKLDDEHFQHVMRRAVAAIGSFSMTDFIPSFGWIIDRLNGVHERLEKSFAEMDAFFQHVVEDRINFKKSSKNEENIVDVLLRMERESSESDALKVTQDCVKALIMDIFLAGVETGASTIVWAMAELVRNPKVMKKLQDKIRSCIKEDSVKEIDLEKLEYLKMVVKEVLRLHPPAPLLPPRETISPFKLNGYDIDPKHHLHINVWAIGRDPQSWTDPEEFFPERFIESNVDYKGQNFELIPFGGGRRICPGMNMAILVVELALANLLLCFDWKPPDGMKEEDVDMEEDAIKKSPLKLIPVLSTNF
ncbi:cytochrome P450 71B2-like [Cucurbita moschata]|uniref:Cytochrome P450 71B2-like n=1 Tax=Cucurbita moschata TaxID=3662 RepID=A0A6J1GWG0_CUCMO|nr:cytochrome P450 71B2-like [Cucurbita moschata]XP_022956401.1 cytochrome P450 71B2-like [Cucurbita moschata]